VTLQPTVSAAEALPRTPFSSCQGLTPRAHQLLARVQRGDTRPDDPLAFLISGGCCGGTNPVLCRRSNILAGFDVQLGEAGGLPVYAHPDHARYLTRDRFLIDALDGQVSDTFSLETPHGGRFVLRELPPS
jgi:uncharacterized protein (DUF779 family)